MFDKVVKRLRLVYSEREFSGEVSHMRPCLLESLDDNVMILP